MTVALEPGRADLAGLDEDDEPESRGLLSWQARRARRRLDELLVRIERDLSRPVGREMLARAEARSWQRAHREPAA